MRNELKVAYSVTRDDHWNFSEFAAEEKDRHKRNNLRKLTSVFALLTIMTMFGFQQIPALARISGLSLYLALGTSTLLTLCLLRVYFSKGISSRRSSDIASSIVPVGVRFVLSLNEVELIVEWQDRIVRHGWKEISSVITKGSSLYFIIVGHPAIIVAEKAFEDRMLFNEFARKANEYWIRMNK